MPKITKNGLAELTQMAREARGKTLRTVESANSTHEIASPPPDTVATTATDVPNGALYTGPALGRVDECSQDLATLGYTAPWTLEKYLLMLQDPRILALDDLPPVPPFRERPERPAAWAAWWRAVEEQRRVRRKTDR